MEQYLLRPLTALRTLRLSLRVGLLTGAQRSHTHQGAGSCCAAGSQIQLSFTHQFLADCRYNVQGSERDTIRVAGLCKRSLQGDAAAMAITIHNPTYVCAYACYQNGSRRRRPRLLSEICVFDSIVSCFRRIVVYTWYTDHRLVC